MDKLLRILIIGAGGIGAYYGARLRVAGHAVTFVARGAHLEAMQSGELQVEHPDFHFQGAVDAVSAEQLIASRAADDFDLVLLTTKAGSTRELMTQLGNWLQSNPQLRVLSLQNGVDNEPGIAELIGNQRTLGGLAVRIGGHVLAPGHISATGPAQVVTGAWPNAGKNAVNTELLARIEQQFNQAGIPTRLSDDIQLELWKKLLINNGVNPLSALTEMDTRTLTHHPRFEHTVYALMQEVVLAARADEVIISDDDLNAMYELIRNFDAIKTSMLVDYEKGRPLELDEIAGAVCERVERLGQRAPVTELVRGLLELKLQKRA